MFCGTVRRVECCEMPKQIQLGLWFRDWLPHSLQRTKCSINRTQLSHLGYTLEFLRRHSIYWREQRCHCIVGPDIDWTKFVLDAISSILDLLGVDNIKRKKLWPCRHTAQSHFEPLPAGLCRELSVRPTRHATQIPERSPGQPQPTRW